VSLLESNTILSDNAIDKFKEFLLPRGDDYFNILKLCCDGAEPKNDRKVFIDLVSLMDME
jgi:hypothetical protein